MFHHFIKVRTPAPSVVAPFKVGLSTPFAGAARDAEVLLDSSMSTLTSRELVRLVVLLASVVAATLVAFFTTLAQAQSGSLPAINSGANSKLELTDVVITASRTAQLVTNALPSTTLITRADIERSQSADLPTLLRQVAGVEIAQNGGAGSVATAFIRGAESRHALVLIDGVAINNAGFGLAALEHLPLANIERIEVVRGNVSSLYGSAALGGVIQIFTRDGAGATAANASAQLGSRGRAQAQVSAAMKAEYGTRLTASVASLNDDGFNAINQALRPGTNPDRDGYSRRSISAGVSQDMGGGQIGLTVRRATGTTRYDSEFGPATQADESTFVESGAQLRGQWAVAPGLDFSAAVSQSADKLDAAVTAYPYFVNSSTRGSNVGLQWLAAPGHTLTAGLETQTQSIDSDTVYTRSSRSENTVRVGYIGELAQHQVQINLRSDRYSDFGDANTWYAGYAYRLSGEWRVQASASTGFNAPTFNDLYYPYGGNATLQPERLRSSEVALQYAQGGQSLRAAWFNNRFTDLIGNDANFARVNINRASNQGLELVYVGRVDDLALRADLTLQDPKDDSTGAQLSRRAKTLAHAGVSRVQGDWSYGADLRYSGERVDGRKALAAGTVADLTLRYALQNGWSVMGRIDNLFDRNDPSVYGYNAAPRGVFVGLSWQMK